MRKRAKVVKDDGAWGGLFEITVWCYLKRIHILLAVGLNIIYVYRFCGVGLRDFIPKATLKMVATQFVDGKLMSADNPCNITPDMNHFVAGRTGHHTTALLTSDKLEAHPYLPDGSRRTAVDAAACLGWRLIHTNSTGDCLIDCFAYLPSL